MYANALTALRNFFDSGATRPIDFRKNQLKKLKAAIERYEEKIYAALYKDLKKSPEECWVTENGFLIAEINNALRHLDGWAAPENVPTNLVNFPSGSRIIKQPLGVVLIIGPWNYPLMLLLTPLVGAIAAGNCMVLKSSEFAPATSGVIKQIITENFSPEYILFTEGDGEQVIPAMMDHFIFNHVFFTGSTAVGKLIYRMAANNLVPVTLELGGKSPCVVEADADIKIAAKRIALAKFSNAGQMCVAPDFILVHQSVKERFLNELKKQLPEFFGPDAKQSYQYGKIINEKQFNRIIAYLDDGKILYGGRSDKNELYIEPTLLTDVSLSSTVMQDEIFGPVLPVIAFNTMDEALNIIGNKKNPLAFYLFTSSKKKETSWLDAVSCGGCCINNASWHLTNHHLPFGGIGNSGMGHYHGKFSFNTFSHQKAVMKTPTWFDPAIKYPPFKGKLKLFKWIIR